MLKRIVKRLKGGVGDVSVGALIIGLVSELLGFDIAPTEVDVIMTGLSMLGVLYQRWQDAREARKAGA